MSKINTKSVILLTLIVVFLCCITAVSATDNNTVTVEQHNNITSTNHTNQLTKQVNSLNNNNTKQLKSSTISTYSQLTKEFKNAQKTNNSSYTINLENNTYKITKSIKLETSNNCHEITINGNGAIIDGQNKYNFLNVSANYTINMNNLTVKNCFSSSKGAVITKDNGCNVTVNLNNISMFSNNVKGLYGEGGSLYLKNSTLNVKNSNFHNNYAYDGGVFVLFNTKTNILNSSFYNNVAKYYGGAIYTDGYLNIRDSKFYQNNAGYRGGAIATTADFNVKDECDVSGPTTISNSVLYYNRAMNGGVISTSSVSNLTIDNCKIYGNNATYGAVVSKTSISATIIKNSSIWNNIAKQGGVVYSIALYEVSFDSNQIVNNSADDGSIIYMPNGTVIINKCNMKDNGVKNGLIYSSNGEIDITNSNITMNDKQYTTYVIYKNGQGKIINIKNYWGTENPDYNVLIKRVNSTVNTTENVNLDEDNEGCSSSIIQVNENESIISFRRDSTVNKDYYITNDTVIRQQKTDNSYFFHCYVTANGWMVGNGGEDSAFLSERIESLTLEMIEKNTINKTYLDLMLDYKESLEIGHVLIKAPNGTYAMVVTYYGTSEELTGVLKSGEFILSPNGPKYSRMGDYVEFTNITDPLLAARYIVASDRYAKKRQGILSYVYTANSDSASVQVYASNDDGHLVGLNTSHLMGDVYTYNQYIPKSQIPNVMDAKEVETVNLTNTVPVIYCKNITAKLGNTISLNATIKDVYGNNINSGKAVVKINDKTFGRVNVSNGTINYDINLTPEDFGKYTYKVTFVYGGNENYTSARKSTILTVTGFKSKYEVSATNNTCIGDTITINVKVTNATGYATRSGNVGLKINGETYKINGKAVVVKVVNGIATFNIKSTSKMIGNNNITITYSGNSQFYKGRTTITNAFTVQNKIRTKCTVNPVNGTLGQNVTLSAKFTNSNRKIMDGQKVAVKINGKTYGYTKITNGMAKFIQYLNPTLFKEDKYNITFTIGETSTHTSATNTSTLTVTPVNGITTFQHRWKTVTLRPAGEN